MSRRARRDKQLRRNLVNREGYMKRYYKRYERAGRKVNSDKHMQHLWITEFKGKPFGKNRKRAPFHNGGKP